MTLCFLVHGTTRLDCRQLELISGTNKVRWIRHKSLANRCISFRPRWSLYHTEASTPAELEWPVIVPDVVFSARVQLPAQLESARWFHPGHFFSDRKECKECTVDIPILIVEYNKAFADQYVDVPCLDQHNYHLMAAMTAAFPLHAVLGLKTPVAGLLINHDKLGAAFLGVLAEFHKQILVHFSPLL